ncbi:hypothetical protein [Pseudomonas syringae group sp. J254-4]|uniref:hypothetical protein n=1 Tax=Pseudomonas syringae group sp. J254-4 TaxID=3079589 RepID=UPI00290DECDB|nr:hypothetical protein [Pseudomonas syringae group sp. J254-4]MDU8458040.1 hypothetical protein [Pseudomonas syringae group sp. J254-4]
MTGPSLVFLRNEADEKEGLGDAGIETFRDAPYASCAREAGQNSRDAIQNNSDPVRMTFDVIDVSVDNIPDFEKLISAIDSCAKTAVSEKEIDFFTSAAAVVARKTIPILRIADYNTEGLIGPPDDPASPFNALLKGAGVSKKDNETSGGSFGIGKNASFAVSDLQTVFYSSLYEDKVSGESKFAAQGKVKLVSHFDSDESNRRAIGYWGGPNFRAITDLASLPEWMRRDELGTSIFCLGFREAPDWAERMVCSLVMNFFVAIQSGDMVFEVDSGRFKINKNTLEALMSNVSIVAAAAQSGFKSDLDFARELHTCLISDASELNVFNIPGLGEIKARVLIGDGLPKRIGFVRNGMLITDNLRHFDKPLSRFPSSLDFIALVEPENNEASKIFKNLENPAHNAFSAERIADSKKRASATKAMRELGDKLRSLIKDVTGVKSQDSTVIDELGKFFANAGKTEFSSTEGSEDDPETYTYKAASKKPKSTFTPNSGIKAGTSHSGGFRDNSKSQNSGGRNGSHESAQKDGSNFKEGKAIQLNDVRNRICTAENSKSTREIFFDSEFHGKIFLFIHALGLNNPQVLFPVETSLGVIRGESILVDVVAKKRCSLKVSFSELYNGPIEVLASVAGEEVSV